MTAHATSRAFDWRAVRVRAALLSLVVVFGWLLGHAARWFADGMVVNAQLYFHAFRIDYVRSPWVWAPLRFLSAAALQYSALASWAFACGYLCARSASRATHVWVAAFVAVTILGPVFTTTSVRIAQPRFFDSAVAASVYPALLNVLFVSLPAYVAVRTVRNRSGAAPVIALVGLIAIALAWWNASELGDALTFGCVWQTTSGAFCPSREIPWGAGGALALTAVGALTTWDGVKAH